MTTIILEQFTGPYDILLQLIDARELSISDVSLSEVTEQFLQYLETLEEEQPEEVADFLTVAARLLLLKSSLLLPTFQVIEEEDVSLTDRLKLYEQFQRASELVYEFWESSAVLGTHTEAFVPKEAFSWPDGLSHDMLRDTMKRIIKRHAPPKPLPKTQIDKAVSLKETIKNLRTILKKGTKTSFWKHADKASKTSVIVHFLALLELTKLGAVRAKQDEHFTDITMHA